MDVYEVLTADGRLFTMPGRDAEHAARRVADLHRVTCVATRPPRISVGPVDARQIVG